ncbi:MAG: threonine synthase [Clostridiales bacterium]|nr:threonine synthase [Clostridiales bacterium]
MMYTSTRDTSVSVSAAKAVIDGIAADGGLYVPKSLPSVDYRSMLGLDYAARVEKVLSAFFDFDVKGIADKAYSSFDSGDPAPVVKLDDKLYMLELWHGKTCAFKDMALSVLPHLLAAAKKAEGDSRETLVLVATSGDTGKAALEGFRDVDGVKVCVFYPTDGVSKVQKLSMQTQDGDNVYSVGIKGNFDEAQSAVKRAFRDEQLIGALAEKNIVMSSANSINIGRLVPQIAYYFSAYCDLVDSDEITAGSKVDFVVPTGNFGNILAGYYARAMGVPINRLVCASNKNNVLTDFIETGTYDINREFFKTLSPSMDILVSSNLERLLFEVSGHDGEAVGAYMTKLTDKGRYDVSPEVIDKIRTIFACGYADDDDCLEAIAEAFDEYGYVLDPHTAAAYSVAESRELSYPTVIASTASPFKFAPAVLTALDEKVGEVTAKTLGLLSDITALDVPVQLAEVFTKPLRFTEIIDKDEILDFIARKFGE